MDENNGATGGTNRWGVCPMENLTTTIQSIDTVRTLHQTIVALRTALEDAKLEIQRLRNQLTAQSEIKESAKLQEKVIETILPEKPAIPEVSLEHVPSPATKVETIKEEKIEEEEQEVSETKSISIIERRDIVEEVETFQHLELPEDSNIPPISSNFTTESRSRRKLSFIPDIRVTARRKMASKIDVKIKVLSNVKVHGASTDTSSSSQPSSARSLKDEMSLPKDTEEGATQLLSTEGLKKDDHSPSGSDNSVFFEDKPPIESATIDGKTSIRPHDSKEEVDDIELIFSSDENREPIQEDLVSISEYDPWQPPGASGTPVLVKFSSLHSESEEGASSLAKKIPASTSHDAVYTANIAQQKSLESSESTDGPRSTKSSSLERETSGDHKDDSHSIGRDESMDFFDHKDSSFGRKWTNYNVIVETDISKCGIIEETTFEMYRRNTCPNPPAYR